MISRAPGWAASFSDQSFFPVVRDRPTRGSPATSTTSPTTASTSWLPRVPTAVFSCHRARGAVPAGGVVNASPPAALPPGFGSPVLPPEASASSGPHAVVTAPASARPSPAPASRSSRLRETAALPPSARGASGPCPPLVVTLMIVSPALSTPYVRLT